MTVAELLQWTAAMLEWGTTYLMLSPRDGIVTKEQIRTMYDGSLFYKIAREVEMKQKKEVQKGQEGWEGLKGE